MCDCYIDKCKECGEEIEMHLGDFNTGRDEVEVYCDVHFPADMTNGVIWVYGDGGNKRRVFVRALTDNAIDNMSENHPNYSFAEISEVPDGLMAVHNDREL